MCCFGSNLNGVQTHRGMHSIQTKERLGTLNLTDRQEGKLGLESKFWLESAYPLILGHILPFGITLDGWE